MTRKDIDRIHIGRPRRWRGRRLAVIAVAAVTIAVGAVSWVVYSRQTLIEVHHAPPVYSPRAADFTANVTGELAPFVRSLEWRLNGGPWRQANQEEPRVPRPTFTVEILESELRPGRNDLELRASAPLRSGEARTLSFSYDPAPVTLPVHIEWTKATQLDVQDGHWEVTPAGRVRPVPGHEGWDRTLAVTGAFAGGRRVETELTLRGEPSSTGWGFGIFPLWGGRPDDPGFSPRRGWRFSLLWYFKRMRGFGCSFSEKIGPESSRFAALYRDLDLKPDKTYRLVTETWPERAVDGAHVRWRQRCKWWPAGQPEPLHWAEVSDDFGVPLPDVPYAVALFSLYASVEFGRVAVTPIPPRTAP